MIQPPSGLNGTSTNPITVQALNDGQVTIDGQFVQSYPVSLSNNSWWVLKGFNVKNGTKAVIRNGEGSNNNIYRRIVAWDTDISLNSSVFYNISSNATLVEDAAFFGTGVTLIQHIGDSGALTCRRCWGRWEGSTTNASPKSGFDMAYSMTPNSLCENCLITASGESMPATYYVTDGNGNTTGATGTATNIPNPPQGIYRIRSDVNNNYKNVQLLGSLAYVRANDSWQGIATILIPGGGADVSGVRVQDTFSYIDPNNARFGSLRGFVLQNSTTAPYDLRAANITSVRGAGDIFSAPWSVTNASVGTSRTAVANAYSGSTGARICYRWTNGQLTSTPLWPWPMNERIKAATAQAGPYSGPCPGCSGGRAGRTQTDVQSQVESVLGTIPTQCRGQ
jgi:hypothetical protein